MRFLIGKFFISDLNSSNLPGQVWVESNHKSHTVGNVIPMKAFKYFIVFHPDMVPIWIISWYITIAVKSYKQMNVQLLFLF